MKNNGKSTKLFLLAFFSLCGGYFLFQLFNFNNYDDSSQAKFSKKLKKNNIKNLNSVNKQLNAKETSETFQDTLTIVEDEPVDLFPDTNLGRTIKQHLIGTMTPAETIEEADRRDAESIAKLREKPKESVAILFDAYRKADEEAYFTRFAILHVISKLDSEHAYPALLTIANSPIGPEKFEDTHDNSSVMNEEVLRNLAVDGLVALASNNNVDVDPDLYRIATDPSQGRALRITAIKGYLSAGENIGERKEKLLKDIEPELHHSITLKVTSRETIEKLMKTVDSEDLLENDVDNSNANSAPPGESTAPEVNFPEEF